VILSRRTKPTSNRHKDYFACKEKAEMCCKELKIKHFRFATVEPPRYTFCVENLIR
jgi:hypothetical protein